MSIRCEIVLCKLKGKKVGFFFSIFCGDGELEVLQKVISFFATQIDEVMVD